MPAKPIVKSEVEVLQNALNHLETKGWTQKRFQKNTGEACLIGAIRIGMREGRVRNPSHLTTGENQMMTRILNILPDAFVRMEARRKKKALSKFLAMKTPFYHNSPIAWNDMPGRTADEVKQLIRAAITTAKNKYGKKAAATK